MPLVSAQYDSIKLRKLPIVRHKASKVTLYSMNPSWLHLILALVPARLVENFDIVSVLFLFYTFLRVVCNVLFQQYIRLIPIFMCLKTSIHMIHLPLT